MGFNNANILVGGSFQVSTERENGNFHHRQWFKLGLTMGKYGDFPDSFRFFDFFLSFPKESICYHGKSLVSESYYDIGFFSSRD